MSGREDSLEALRTAAEDFLEAVEAYFNPENQYTESRYRTVKRTEAAMLAALRLSAPATTETTP